MFRTDCMWSFTQTEKSKRHRTKKSKSLKRDLISKHSKNSKCSKSQRNHKHSRFKHINTISKYVGPERLTTQIGFFTKGKISDSISRIEKILPKEVKARAQQDLQEVLKLTSGKSMHQKSINVSCGSVSSEDHSLQSLYKSPQYLHHKTGFASNSWKDKLQKSVGASVNSVLASVHELPKTSPIKELQLIARNVLINVIHPFIEETNALLFPNHSTKDKIKKKLLYIRNQLTPNNATITSEITTSSSIQEISQISSNMETNNSQNTIEDFHLNPIFTGDDIDRSDITQIFPSTNGFKNGTNDLISTDADSVNLLNQMYNFEAVSSQGSSFSYDGENSVNLVPTSPTTSDDSPVWKLQVSPVKFIPESSSTPTLYFRHKMF